MKWKTHKTESGHDSHLLSGAPFPVFIVAHRDGRGFSAFARAKSGLAEKVGSVRGKVSLEEFKAKVERALAAL